MLYLEALFFSNNEALQLLDASFKRTLLTAS